MSANILPFRPRRGDLEARLAEDRDWWKAAAELMAAQAMTAERERDRWWWVALAVLAVSFTAVIWRGWA